jgi:hypothetical protein
MQKETMHVDMRRAYTLEDALQTGKINAKLSEECRQEYR